MLIVSCFVSVFEKKILLGICWILYVNTNFQDLNVIDMVECNVNKLHVM